MVHVPPPDDVRSVDLGEAVIGGEEHWAGASRFVSRLVRCELIPVTRAGTLDRAAPHYVQGLYYCVNCNLYI